MRIVILLLVLSSVAYAQAPGQTPPRNTPRGPQQAAHDKREAIKKKIRTMRAFALTDELGLDEAQAAKLFPILSRSDDVSDKLLQARVDIQRRLSSATDPKVLDRAIDDAVANQKAFWQLEEKRLAEMRKVLTPAQTARLLVVLPAFERKIQNQLRRTMMRQQRQQRGGARVEEDDIDEDDLDLDDARLPRRR